MGSALSETTNKDRLLGKESFRDTYIKAIREELSVFKETGRYVQAAKDVGMADWEIAKVADTYSVSLRKDFLEGMITGSYKIPSPKDVLSREYKKELKLAGDDLKKKAAVEAKYAEAANNVYDQQTSDAIYAILDSEGINYHE